MPYADPWHCACAPGPPDRCTPQDVRELVTQLARAETRLAARERQATDWDTRYRALVAGATLVSPCTHTYTSLTASRHYYLERDMLSHTLAALDQQLQQAADRDGMWRSHECPASC
jgi:hypothetical protein